MFVNGKQAPKKIIKKNLCTFGFVEFQRYYGDLDCVAAVERLPVLHYSLDFIFLSFGIMGFIVEL